MTYIRSKILKTHTTHGFSVTCKIPQAVRDESCHSKELKLCLGEKAPLPYERRRFVQSFISSDLVHLSPKTGETCEEHKHWASKLTLQLTSLMLQNGEVIVCR